MEKKNSASNQTCSDCIHHWACAAWNIGEIGSMDGTHCANFERWGSDRLRELAEADKDGRLVVLPCPFYSEVYALSQVGEEIIHGELRSTNQDYCLIVNLDGNLTSKGKTWHGVQVRKQDVFLTRKEAESALEVQK